MKNYLFAVLALIGLTLPGAADIFDEPNPYDDADTLRFFLAKSHCVVVATVHSSLMNPGSGPIYEPGVIKLAPVDWLTGITIERVLYGPAPTEKELMVHVYRMTAQNGVSGLGLENEKSYIFFLKRCEPTTRINDHPIEWSTADVWFGLFPFDTALAERLKKLEEERLKTLDDIKGVPRAPTPFK